jgi:hypothetical protein
MTTLEFHDALVVEVAGSGANLVLRMERVFVYEGDRLLRQEGGKLHIQGIGDFMVDGRTATPRRELEYGRILNWDLDHGHGRLLVEWVAFSPIRQLLTNWTFRYIATQWEPEFMHDD